MMTDFQILKDFNFTDSLAHLWVFKDSSSAARFRSYYVQTDEQLNNQLKAFVISEIERITEHSPYSYISQTNENSCLTLNYDTTDFPHLKNVVDRVEAEHRVTSLKDLRGSKGYVVKFQHNGNIVYGIKRSTSMWKTSYSKKFINMVFSNGELAGVENNSFSIEKSFDFYVVNSKAFIANKKGFESILKYNREYSQAFEQLQLAPEFSGLFSSLDPIIEHVGSNSMHLRRMAVIEEKGLYNKPNFLSNFQKVSDMRKWGINFDPEANTIVPCSVTVKIILQVLLDHRLISEITDTIYDVPDATQV